MTFLDYLKKLDKPQQEALAKRCDTSVGHLKQVAHGYRPASPKLCVLIEKATNGLHTRQSLRPNDWDQIWPELQVA